MKIGIVSDIHDRRDHLAGALAQLKSMDVLFCLGDLCSPFIMRDMVAGFAKDIHVVFGNNDGDPYRILEGAAEGGNARRKIRIHPELAEITLAGKRFALNHYNTIGRALARSGLYDVVCFGHNHVHQIERTGDTIVINPGEIMGGIHGTPTYAVYDTGTHEADIFTLDGNRV